MLLPPCRPDRQQHHHAPRSTIAMRVRIILSTASMLAVAGSVRTHAKGPSTPDSADCSHHTERIVCPVLPAALSWPQGLPPPPSQRAPCLPLVGRDVGRQRSCAFPAEYGRRTYSARYGLCVEPAGCCQQHLATSTTRTSRPGQSLLGERTPARWPVGAPVAPATLHSPCLWPRTQPGDTGLFGVPTGQSALDGSDIAADSAGRAERDEMCRPSATHCLTLRSSVAKLLHTLPMLTQPMRRQPDLLDSSQGWRCNGGSPVSGRRAIAGPVVRIANNLFAYCAYVFAVSLAPNDCRVETMTP
jgi:hypothetical protein